MRRKIYIHEEREQGGASKQSEDMRKGMEAWKWEVPGPEINSEWKELRMYVRESVGGRNLH